MLKRERLKSKHGAQSPSAEQLPTAPANVGSKSKLAVTDDLLDDIDEILAEVTLHESAESFVRSYHQRGGE